MDIYKCQKCRTKLLSDMREKDYQNGFMNGKAELSPDEIERRRNVCKQGDL